MDVPEDCVEVAGPDEEDMFHLGISTHQLTGCDGDGLVVVVDVG